MATTWYPDTCDCVHQQVDDGAGDVMHVGTERVCADHGGLAGLAAYTQARKESSTKNNVRALAAETVAKLRKTNPDGSVDLPDTVTYAWSFTGLGLDRTLTVQFSGVNLSNADKTALRNAIAAAPARVPVTTTVS